MHRFVSVHHDRTSLVSVITMKLQQRNFSTNAQGSSYGIPYLFASGVAPGGRDQGSSEGGLHAAENMDPRDVVGWSGGDIGLGEGWQNEKAKAKSDRAPGC
jgi:hypothetical protein